MSNKNKDVQNSDIQILDAEQREAPIRSVKQSRKASFKGYGLNVIWESETVTTSAKDSDNDR